MNQPLRPWPGGMFSLRISTQSVGGCPLAEEDDAEEGGHSEWPHFGGNLIYASLWAGKCSIREAEELLVQGSKTLHK